MTKNKRDLGVDLRNRQHVRDPGQSKHLLAVLDKEL